MITACLFVAGTLRAALPAPEFSVEWSHSVEHTRWTEHYAAAADALELTQARVEGSGAGMEAGEGARFDGAGWTWAPHRRLDALLLTESPYTADYVLCSGGRCEPLHRWADIGAGETTTVRVAPCPAKRG